MSQDAKEGDDGLNLKFHTKLLPKTVAEIEEVHARVRKLFVRKRTKAIQKPKVKTAAERKIEATQRQKDIKDYSKSIGYSKYYYDEQHEYRHVVLPKILAKWLPHAGLLKEEEWSSLGVSQSSGWQHYMVYAPEPHILLFRREKDYLAKHGEEVLPARQEVKEKAATPEASNVVPEPKPRVRSTRSSSAATKAAKALEGEPSAPAN